MADDEHVLAHVALVSACEHVGNQEKGMTIKPQTNCLFSPKLWLCSASLSRKKCSQFAGLVTMWQQEAGANLKTGELTVNMSSANSME